MHPIMWQFAEYHSQEFFKLHEDDTEITLNGRVILMLENIPTHIHYQIICDTNWHTRTVNIQQTHGEEIHVINLTVDERNIWRIDSDILREMEGIIDVDLEITPATNTLPINRLNLEIGQSAMVRAAWVRFPKLIVQALEQRYTRLTETRYEYHNPASGFTTGLEVDEFGVVIDYGDLWKRVRS
ncbi:MAG: putative glycolipid-binding domain-containing protein [Aggregatilineales bacterium]